MSRAVKLLKETNLFRIERPVTNTKRRATMKPRRDESLDCKDSAVGQKVSRLMKVFLQELNVTQQNSEANRNWSRRHSSLY